MSSILAQVSNALGGPLSKRLSACLAIVAFYVYLTRSRYLSWKMNFLCALIVQPSVGIVQGFTRFPSDRRTRIDWTRQGRELHKVIDTINSRLAPVDSVAKVEDVLIPSREGGRSIRVRLYRPASVGEEVSLPVVFVVHGGGWIYGGLQVSTAFNKMLCARSKTVVCAVEYRLAPEHPFPCGLEDCEDALRWVWSEPTDLTVAFRASPRNRGLALCGESAGGNLCAVLAVFAKNDGIRLDLQALLYPAVSAFSNKFWRKSNEWLPCDSTVIHANAPMLSTEMFLTMWDMYLSNPSAEITNPRVSPILFSPADLYGVARAYVITAEVDILRDEGMEYVKLLQQSGVVVKHVHYEDTVHGFLAISVANHYETAISNLSKEVKDVFANQTIAARD